MSNQDSLLRILVRKKAGTTGKFRMKKQARFLLLSLIFSTLALTLTFCEKGKTEAPVSVDTCKDGILNGDESGVDCGGSCVTACETCTDIIQNQDEKGIDCGGACEPCSTNACTTALGYGENGYLPNGTSTVSVEVDTVSSHSSKAKVTLGFPLFYTCSQYTIDFFGKAFLKMPVNTTQVFTTAGPSNAKANECSVQIYMMLENLFAERSQKVYVTKVSATTYNIRFCKLTVHKAIGSPYTLNTSFSANANFTL